LTTDAQAVEKVVAFLRHVEAFPWLSFAARRRHLSRARFLERLAAMEALVGAELVVVGDDLSLTPFAIQILGANSDLAESRR
jgi:DNA-binding transcriptional LysR family regulator